jgi:hypothetical protein
MQISESQKQDVLRKLSALTGQFTRCAVCNREGLVPSDVIFELREFHAGGLYEGGPILPVLPVSCGNCGNTLFFNALHLGLIEQPSIAIEKADGR